MHTTRTSLQRAALGAALVLPLALACGKADTGAAADTREEALAVTLAAPPVAPGGDGSAFSVGSSAAAPAGRSARRAITAKAMPGRPGSRPEMQAEQSSAVLQPGSRATTDTTSVIANAMLIRTGNATIEVDSLERAIAAVQAMARQLGGYVANTSLMVGDRQPRRADMELKFPSARFDEATGALRPLGKVEALSVNTQDVGEEFVDMTARMNNARRLEERLIDLLARRTGKLEDMLAVERELARVREEIERYEGHLRFLRSRTAMSTLSVTVHEPAPVFAPHAGPSRIGEAFREAWRNFVGFMAALISSLGWLVPLLLIAGVVVWGARRWLPARPTPAPAPSPSPRPTPMPEKRDAA